jgi:enoyl-CoA hydratase/carnithine racemase
MSDAANTEDELLYSARDGIGHIVLNRPHRRNALTFGMYERITQICARAGGGDDPDGLKVLIFSGGGDAAFAAGTDISQFRTFTTDDAINYEAMVDRVMTGIEECRIPTIAALNGFCTGGGAAIAAAVDLRIGSRDLKVGAPIARTLGNCLAIANIYRFVRLIGEARLKYMLLTASLIDAEEAASAGFISELLDDREAVLARAEEMAHGITELAPLTLDATMRGIRRLSSATPLPDDHDLVKQTFGSADFKEGISAFFEKRKPDWKGV